MIVKHQPLGSRETAQGEALLRLYPGTREGVEAGYYAAFTVCESDKQTTLYVSARCAVHLLLALGQPLTDYQPGAVAKGQAMRVEYHDCKNVLVLGTYAPREMWRYYRAAAYLLEKRWRYRDRHIARLEAENEQLRREIALLDSWKEHEEALAIWEGRLSL